MNTITAPFTDEQVAALNATQTAGKYHPFTCDPGAAGRNSRAKCPDGEGVLIATRAGWVCPCGAYRQQWAHEFMATPEASTPFAWGMPTAPSEGSPA